MGRAPQVRHACTAFFIFLVFATAIQPTSVAIAEISGDGKSDLAVKPDLVVAKRDNSTVMLGANQGFVLRSDAFASAGGFVAGSGSIIGMTAAQSVTGLAVRSDNSMIETVGFWRRGILPPVVGVEDPPSGDGLEMLHRFALYPIAPNPSSRITNIRYAIPTSGRAGVRATIRILDVSGRLVRTLVAGAQEPGVHSITWDGLNTAGTRVGAGVYFVEFAAASTRRVRRLVMLR